MSRLSRIRSCGVIVAAAVFLVGCSRRADTRPLDDLGMNFSRIQELHEMKVSDEEVLELAKARQGGIAEETCVELVRLARSRLEKFTSGDAAASLRRVSMSDASILELARLNQFGLFLGEAQAIRLTGLGDAVILEIARRRAAGEPTLSGPSLARMKNVGVSEETMLALVRGGATDENADAIVERHRRAAGGNTFRRNPPRR